eukprot:1190110-Prorocentrum_minimum.AAC.4
MSVLGDIMKVVSSDSLPKAQKAVAQNFVQNSSSSGLPDQPLDQHCDSHNCDFHNCDAHKQCQSSGVAILERLNTFVFYLFIVASESEFESVSSRTIVLFTAQSTCA